MLQVHCLHRSAGERSLRCEKKAILIEGESLASDMPLNDISDYLFACKALASGRSAPSEADSGFVAVRLPDVGANLA